MLNHNGVSIIDTGVSLPERIAQSKLILAALKGTPFDTFLADPSITLQRVVLAIDIANSV